MFRCTSVVLAALLSVAMSEVCSQAAQEALGSNDDCKTLISNSVQSIESSAEIACGCIAPVGKDLAWAETTYLTETTDLTCDTVTSPTTYQHKDADGNAQTFLDAFKLCRPTTLAPTPSPTGSPVTMAPSSSPITKAPLQSAETVAPTRTPTGAPITTTPTSMPSLAPTTTTTVPTRAPAILRCTILRIQIAVAVHVGTIASVTECAAVGVVFAGVADDEMPSKAAVEGADFCPCVSTLAKPSASDAAKKALASLLTLDCEIEGINLKGKMVGCSATPTASPVTMAPTPMTSAPTVTTMAPTKAPLESSKSAAPSATPTMQPTSAPIGSCPATFVADALPLIGPVTAVTECTYAVPLLTSLMNPTKEGAQAINDADLCPCINALYASTSADVFKAAYDDMPYCAYVVEGVTLIFKDKLTCPDEGPAAEPTSATSSPVTRGPTKDGETFAPSAAPTSQPTTAPTGAPTLTTGAPTKTTTVSGATSSVVAPLLLALPALALLA